jgi:hypothetical protein
MGKVEWSDGNTGYTKPAAGGRTGGNWEFGCHGENRDELGRKGTFEPRMGKASIGGARTRRASFSGLLT